MVKHRGWRETGGGPYSDGLEIPRLNIEVLHSAGYASGPGSNDIGIDRGALAGNRIVFFERLGPRVLMVQPIGDAPFDWIRR